VSEHIIVRAPAGPLQWLDSVRRALDRFPLSIVQLVMRVAVGSVFLKAGLLKYRSPELTLLLFRDEYMVPFFDPALLARVAPSTSSRSRRF
jgi:putative oxidoreductase